uniref:CBS domain-containing protein n=1 Tax=Mucochytrium quahogii TaxID=96639 RepID=A0A7S2S3V2_9STRA|mmetsp:Transcript_9333/g.15200  ORF Transcript_9333/g.15200 Transcript_9333/m.15200 type:complete len:200 (-) Transcript_9333:105-704(-)|eukprot:CAMPEP_0203798626 /NCGR_PEP_ID=MMETSP0100_2-20121128/9400_1 /ASSEMBLY_ACC=CAM_ASM_000210 /TAXON_ID=96639 /ORGANISM=" , Strain NY0313808BC1" /LENGTH=199 /DNA_ID=CAMNT_0050704287 /DNA_START=32 /DNA_END=631 /DNA_ORIENTATION=+
MLCRSVRRVGLRRLLRDGAGIGRCLTTGEDRRGDPVGGWPMTEKTVEEIINLDEQARKIAAWTIGHSETVFEATRKMVEHRTGSLCVTRDDQIVGIVTERDYLTKVLHAGRTSKTTPVEEISTMGDKLVVATPQDNLQDCVDMMVQKQIRHLPVAESDGTVIGLLDIQDIAKTLADERQVTMQTLDEIRIASNMPIHDG